MRRVITLLCLVLGIGCNMLAMNGTGTAEDPYQISTADDLYEFADIVSGLHKSIDQNLNAHAVLMNDITINENVLDEEGNLNAGTFREWRPICKYQVSGARGYQGVFDGQKHVIRGVYCTEGGDMSGFFSVLSSGAEVINVGFEDCYIESSMGRDGGIGGQCWGGHIRNCYFIGVVDGDGSEIGGICSLIDSGTIENCFSVANLSGHSRVDGICAINQKSEIRNCYSMPLKGADTELKERFLTGEIAYLLQQGQTEHVWGQKIGVDKHPVFDGNKVYACTDSVLKYSNHVDCGESHVFDHCVCTYCGYRDTTCICEHVYDHCVCIYCGEANHDLDHCVCKVCGFRDTTCVCEHVYDHCVCIYCGEANHDLDHCVCKVCGFRDTTCVCEHVYVRCICIYCGEANHDLDHCVCKVCGFRDTTCVCEHVYDHCVCTYCGYRDTTCICELN